MLCSIAPLVTFSESSSPLTYSRRLLPSATAARCVHRWSARYELDQMRSPDLSDLSVVDTKNSTPRVLGSRKILGVRSPSTPPLCTSVRHRPVASELRYTHSVREKEEPASLNARW